METPIYDKLRRDGHYLFHQCEDCKEMGWPVGMFECVADNFDCIDYYDPPIQPTKPMTLEELREALVGTRDFVKVVDEIQQRFYEGVVRTDEVRRRLLG